MNIFLLYTYKAFLAVNLILFTVLPAADRGGLLAQTQAKDAEMLQNALKDKRVLSADSLLRSRKAELAELLIEIGGIISPSGQELERAERVAAEMRDIGLQQVRVDGLPNAVGVIPGLSGKALIFVSTLDDLPSVADNQKAANGPPVIDGDRVTGPGTNTSATTAAMLEAARAFVRSGIEPTHDLVFAAVAQEETGLTGMKALFEEYKDRAIAFVDILGDGRSISYGALSIHWYKVIGEGPPGHSLGGGLPNVNQALARAVDRILTWSADIQDPQTRTVVNTAILRSGQVFNHKPQTGWFSLDLRSLESSVIEDMETEIAAILERVSKETGITLTMVPEQLTPGGQIPGFRNSGLVRAAAGAVRYLGREPSLSNAGSSNMNIALGSGVPAIGLGGSRGGQRGFPDEWADIPAMLRSARLVFLLAVTAGGVR